MSTLIFFLPIVDEQATNQIRDSMVGDGLSMKNSETTRG